MITIIGRTEPVCQYCEQAKKDLNNRGINFEFIDVEKNESSRQLLNSLGLKSVPQLFYNNEHIGDSSAAKTFTIGRMATKRNGDVVPFKASCINNMAEWAIADSNVTDWSSIVMTAMHKLPVGDVTTDQIQKSLIQSFLDKKQPKYNKVAGRLLLGEIRRSSLASNNFTDFYHTMVETGYWRDMGYDDIDLDYLGSFINQDKDLGYGYPALRQMLDKYMIKDTSGVLLELPQYMYMGIAMSLFDSDPLDDVVMYYKKASDQKINIPTPVMTGQRTKSNVGVSCIITTAGDSLQGIATTEHIAFMGTASSAGMGAEYNVRSPKDDVRQGYAKAGGKLPHYKVMDKIVKSVSQNCYDDQTEVLTNRGYVLFSDIKKDDLLAQVHDGGKLDFVKPINIFEYDYSGDMIKFTDNGKNRKVVDLLVTPNHTMCYRYNKHDKTNDTPLGYTRIEGSYIIEDKFSECLANDFTPKRCTIFERASIGNGELDEISAFDRLRIAFQADSYANYRSKKGIHFHISKQHKIDKLINLAKLNNFEFSVNNEKNGSTNIIIQTGYDLRPLFDKDFDWVDITKISSNWGRGFMDELRNWDGSKQDSNCESYSFSNTNKTAINKVSAIASVSGITHSISKTEFSNPKWSDLYNLGYAMNRRFVSGRGCKKETIQYSGKVYCAEVPTNKLMVRRNGMSVVCGNSRGGSATITFNILDPEIETLLKLKLPRTVEEKRIDMLDYSLCLNNDFLRRAARKEKWCLVSKRINKELHNSFYHKRNDFSFLMDQAIKENQGEIVNAFDLLVMYLNARAETGRVYMFNVDNVNDHTPFEKTVRLSNLCQEVALPTDDYNHITELFESYKSNENGLTAQCFLSATDVARIEDDQDYEDTTYITVKAIDNLMQKMDYPFEQFKSSADQYRSIGVGITNLAYCLAKNNKSYTDVDFIHSIAERHYYFLLKASIRLAKERGSFPLIDETKWKYGWLPIDTYNKNVDKLWSIYNYNWELIREEVLEYGVRFSTLCAHMPCESSSVVSCATNSIYPIRSYLIYKDSRSGKIQIFAPECDQLVYESAWDLPNKDLINAYACVQKFTDQSISADTYVDYTKQSKIPLSESINNFLYANKMGLKTLYYQNSKTGRGIQEKEETCESCSL